MTRCSPNSHRISGSSCSSAVGRHGQIVSGNGMKNLSTENNQRLASGNSGNRDGDLHCPSEQLPIPIIDSTAEYAGTPHKTSVPHRRPEIAWIGIWEWLIVNWHDQPLPRQSDRHRCQPAQRCRRQLPRLRCIDCVPVSEQQYANTKPLNYDSVASVAARNIMPASPASTEAGARLAMNSGTVGRLPE
ncbi:uncharacterized protein LOC129602456 [Paramacrobiotus metropolitanus]|uniref:uncharacterized protein LOC129602456 n=1 Tax=Paramacrobiotus metropolitanus TaxID=2943436 RepID=UPI002446168C|nr:uncharacterized protein LOC129602456 [Paramacrobiotus metropolitanus]